MLIGADVYWDIVTGNIKRNPNTGLVAISSAFGWLMNGPVTDRSDKSEEKLNLAVAHVMRVQCEKREETLLSERINNFWHLDLLGITEEEEYSKGLGNVTFQDGDTR